MTPRTWDEAAESAAAEILNTSRRAGPLEAVAFDLDWLADEVRRDFPQYIAMGAVALNYATDLHGFLAREGMLDEIVETVISKQHDYGTENIAAFGERGLQVRVHDKVARLKNLYMRDTVARNEPLLDSWADIVGYAIVATMFRNDTFFLPLQSDRDEQALDDAELAQWMAGGAATIPVVGFQQRPFEIVNAPLDEVVDKISTVVDLCIARHVEQHHQRTPIYTWEKP